METTAFNTVGRFEWQTPAFVRASHIESMIQYIGVLLIAIFFVPSSWSPGASSRLRVQN